MKRGVKAVWKSCWPLLVWGLVAFSGCNRRVSNPETPLPPSDRIDVPTFGQPNTLEVATWNIETFPMLGGQTVEDVVEIMLDLKVDIYALEEITDASAFRNIYQNLPHHSGRLANFQSGGNLRTGVIYDTTVVELVSDSVLFDNDYDFPRPAYRAYFRLKSRPQLNFSLYVLHLKAFGDPESEGRRRRAVQKLKAFLDTDAGHGGDPDVILAGDWNDELTDPPAHNIFLPFLSDSLNYCVLTDSLARQGNEFSFIKSPFSFLDHLIASRSFKNQVRGWVVDVLEIDQAFNAYLAEVSDHRPVAVRFNLP
ncbi:MAG: hypothetical protein D6715_05285 [Calditrichaeota bacterium]|nr:MAG: hypothetical protein D6715_05285 [Calditrichota bacterium]